MFLYHQLAFVFPRVFPTSSLDFLQSEKYVKFQRVIFMANAGNESF